MSQPFLGEIRMFAGTYAPRHYTFCHGQLLPVSQNSALYSLLGTAYGGDGRTSFGLPDFRGRIPIHKGQGPGLPNYPLGAKFGTETVTLTKDHIPPHNHPLQATTQPSDSNVVTGGILSHPQFNIYAPITDATRITTLASEATGNTGGNGSHSNMMPTLCINFIICIQGIYPSRN